MKQFFYLIFILVILFDCTQTKKNGLSALIVNNALNGTATDKYTNESLLDLRRADLANLSFTGVCYDSFTFNTIPVSPTNYYNTPAGGYGGKINTDIEKHTLSTSNCSSLGFSPASNTSFGSSTQRPSSDTSFNYKMYSCDPNNNPCSAAAIKAAGF